MPMRDSVQLGMETSMMTPQVPRTDMSLLANNQQDMALTIGRRERTGIAGVGIKSLSRGRGARIFGCVDCPRLRVPEQGAGGDQLMCRAKGSSGTQHRVFKEAGKRDEKTWGGRRETNEAKRE